MWLIHRWRHRVAIAKGVSMGYRGTNDDQDFADLETASSQTFGSK